MTETDQSPERQVEAASKAFEQEFERFARFTGDQSQLIGLDLEAAMAEERALAELRTRHLGKKSALAATKKLIGRVAPEERAAFGQLVQSTEAALIQAFDTGRAESEELTSSSSARRARVSTSRSPAGVRAPAIVIRSRLLRERFEDIFVVARLCD